MDWGVLAEAAAPLVVPAGAVGILLSFSAWVLYRYAQGRFVSEAEHNRALDRITSLETQNAEERAGHQTTRDTLHDTVDTLREAMTQNGMLIQAAAISTEVMKRIDQRGQEGGHQ